MKTKDKLIKFPLNISIMLHLDNNKKVVSFWNRMSCKIPRPFCDKCAFENLCTEVVSEIDKVTLKLIKKDSKKRK